MSYTIEQIEALFSEQDQKQLRSLAEKAEQVSIPKDLISMWNGLHQEHNTHLMPIEAFWRKYQLSEQLDHMAYPLSSKAIQFIQQQTQIAEGESFPQFPYLITTLTSLLARQWCIWSIQLYLEISGKDANINIEIVKIIQSPTDNQWWSLLTNSDTNRGLLAWLSKNKCQKREQQQLFKTIEQIIKSKPMWNPAGERDRFDIHNVSNSGKKSNINNVGQLFKFLLAYRNKLIHAEPLTEQDTHNAALVLETFLHASIPLNQFIMYSKVHEDLYELTGMFPKKLTVPQSTETEKENDASHTNFNHLQTMANRDMVLYYHQNPLFSLSPLVTLAQDINQIDEAKDIDFINKGSVQNLRYVGFVNGEQQDGESLGSYETFKKYLASIPIPPGGTDNPVIDFSDFSANKSKNFVGRTDVLTEIDQCIQTKGGHYIFLKALAGMGKSAIMAHLYQQFASPSEDNEQVSDNIWLFHFCMHTNGRDNAVTSYRSLLVQLQQALGTYNRKRNPSMDIKELKELFQSTLNSAGPKLEKLGKQKIVVVLDALDEISFMEEDNIITSIPESIQEHVVFLLSYRVDVKGFNQRVESRLQGLPSDQCHILTHANPLKGLTREDVSRFVDKLNTDHLSIPQALFDTVWMAASTELLDYADPFYLRFVADGVEKRQYFLTRPETIPTSLNGAFEQMWLSLPNDRNFLAHRLLVTLGVMRDLGDDELFAELFTRQFNQPFTEEEIATIRRPIGKLLAYDGDRYGLFHDRFRFFLVGEQKDPIAEALALEE